MNKIISNIAMVFIAMFLVSWGSTGHKTVAEIAEKHLSEKSKEVIKIFIGSASLASVSTWADDVRSTAGSKNTASWHYLNVPLGLRYADFERAVKSQPDETIYSALLKNEKVLTDPNSELEARVKALKFIVHFVGDIHQPMHVSRVEDKGGNTIQVRFDEKGTNLHSLWDSKLIEHQGLDYKKLAATIDKGTSDINLNADSPIQWLYESYQISSQLYAEVKKSGAKLNKDYYNQHIEIVNKRLAVAGLRLAMLLNKLFEAPVYNLPLPAKPASEPDNLTEIQKINIDYVSDFVGQQAQITGKVYGIKKFNSLILANLGSAYPNQKLTVVFKGELMKLANDIDGKTISVSGLLTKFKGKPQIVIKDKNELVIQN
jgi:hypothetical protein